MLAWLAAMLGLALIAGSIAPQPLPKTVPSAPRPGAPGTVPSRSLKLVLHPGERVVARVGDVVTLTVPATAPDTVQIAGLGLSAFADATVPAQIEFVAYPAGTFPVTLLTSGATVGTLRILPAQSPQPAPAAPSRSVIAAA